MTDIAWCKLNGGFTSMSFNSNHKNNLIIGRHVGHDSLLIYCCTMKNVKILYINMYIVISMSIKLIIKLLWLKSGFPNGVNLSEKVIFKKKGYIWHKNT